MRTVVLIITIVLLVPSAVAHADTNTTTFENISVGAYNVEVATPGDYTIYSAYDQEEEYDNALIAYDGTFSREGKYINYVEVHSFTTGLYYGLTGEQVPRDVMTELSWRDDIVDVSYEDHYFHGGFMVGYFFFDPIPMLRHGDCFLTLIETQQAPCLS